MVRVILLLVLLLPALASAQVPAAVERERAKYGERVSPADAPVLLAQIARGLTTELPGQWGLLVKTEGNNCGSFACDIICNASEHFDVLIDGPDAAEGYAGTARPSWQPKGPYAPRVCSFVNSAPTPPPQPPPTPVPVPVPTPTPAPSCDLSPLYLQLSTLQATCAALKVWDDAYLPQFEAHAKSLEEHREQVRGFWSKYWPQVVTGAITGVVGAFTAYRAKNTAAPTPAPQP